MADRKAIYYGLLELSQNWKGHLSGKEVEQMCDTWGKCFAEASDVDFLAGIQEALNRCRFFPKPSEIHGFIDEIRQRHRTSTPALPPVQISDAQIERNRKQAANMRARFSGEFLPFPELARGMMDVDDYQAEVKRRKEIERATRLLEIKAQHQQCAEQGA